MHGQKNIKLSCVYCKVGTGSLKISVNFMHEMVKCTLLNPCPLSTYAICYESCKCCINLSVQHAARYAHKESISRPYIPWVDYSEHRYWREYRYNSNAGYVAGRKYVKRTLNKRFILGHQVKGRACCYAVG
jgi:hypothetical protein